MHTLRTVFVVKPDDIVAMLIYICFIAVRHCKEKKLALNYAGAGATQWLVNELCASVVENNSADALYNGLNKLCLKLNK